MGGGSRREATDELSAVGRKGRADMTTYRIPIIIKPPSTETEDKYLAEVPALPGCRAWGDTIPEALAFVRGVAAAFIESYRERGDALPPTLAEVGEGTDTVVIQTELLVST